MKTAAHTSLEKIIYAKKHVSLHLFLFFCSLQHNGKYSLCYEKSICDILVWAKSIHATGGNTRYNYEKLAVVNPSESVSWARCTIGAKVSNSSTLGIIGTVESTNCARYPKEPKDFSCFLNQFLVKNIIAQPLNTYDTNTNKFSHYH